MKYFKNLHVGWANLEIENFKGHVSYTRNVPWDILKAYEEYMIYGHCIIPFDEEGTDFSIYVDDVSVIILRYNGNNDGYEIHEIGTTPSVFIKTIALDIAENLARWHEWYYMEGDETDFIDLKDMELACIKLGLLKTEIIDFIERSVQIYNAKTLQDT